MADYVYRMENLSRHYPGGREVLRNISLSFLSDAKIGVLGLNGAGKSTLLRIMAGIDQDFTGEAAPIGEVKVGYLPQEPVLDETKTVGENIFGAVAELKSTLDQFQLVSEKLGSVSDEDEMTRLIEEQAMLQDKIEAARGWDLDKRIDMAMQALRCPSAESGCTDLSGGERRRVALCRLLLEQPDILLLDEPTNHLDASSVAWLEYHLQSFSGMVVMVTHDRYFLDNITSWILEIDQGQGIPYKGNYAAWLEARQKRLEGESKKDAARLRVLSEERAWMSRSPQARRAKSQARISSYEKLREEASQAEKRSDRQIIIPSGNRLGDLVVTAEGISKTHGGNLLFEGLSFIVPAGGIVGIIGPNGAGKTSFLRLIAGQDQPDMGKVVIGSTVEIGYVDQSRATLEGDNSVWKEISGGDDTIKLGSREVNSRAWVGAFGFRGPDQQKKLSLLSGGERNRVHLAKILKTGANLLLLDEPTNDLDLETLRALEEALLQFSGSAMVISHDRWFLDRIATHILAFENDSETVWFQGGYSEYEEDRLQRLGDVAAFPQRVKYRHLTRD